MVNAAIPTRNNKPTQFIVPLWPLDYSCPILANVMKAKITSILFFQMKNNPDAIEAIKTWADVQPVMKRIGHGKFMHLLKFSILTFV